MIKVRTVLAVLTLALAGLFASVGTASAVTSGDPLATGCATGAQTIWQMTYFGAGTVEVRYSPSCGTNWVKVTGAGGKPSEAGSGRHARAGSTARPTATAPTLTGHQWFGLQAASA